MRLALSAGLLAALTVPAGLVQTPSQDKPTAPARSQTREAVLVVEGDVPKPLSFTAAEFARLPRQRVRATERDGAEAEFEGVPIVELLKATGLKLGEDLRGPALASYLVVEAFDGYRVVFALPELDPAFTDRIILLADRRAGRPLSPTEGPLRVVVPGEKRHARWAREVVKLKVVKA